MLGERTKKGAEVRLRYTNDLTNFKLKVQTYMRPNHFEKIITKNEPQNKNQEIQIYKKKPYINKNHEQRKIIHYVKEVGT